MDNLIQAILDSIKRLDYFKSEIFSITTCVNPVEVHITLEVFLENFSNYVGSDRECNIYPIELSHTIEGVKFLALATVEDFTMSANPLSLPLDTRVMVSEDGEVWLRRYLHHTEKSLVDPSHINAVVFPMGCDSWTFKNFKGGGMNPRLTVWTKWRLAEESE